MIVFLTLCYVVVLFLLVKVNIIKLNLWWKLSPLVWVLVLLIAFFIPMQWGAPAGPATAVRHAVSIVPNVRGQVVEVNVEPNTLVKKGEVLFRIDPTQYQAKVDQLSAQLKLAELREQQFTQLEARDAGSRFQVEEAQANVGSLRAQLADAKWQLDSTTVRAPTDGFATNVALRPGARVGAVPLAATMPFFDASEMTVGVQIHQIHARFIKLGQEAEITFKQFPGQIFGATVESILPAISQGQVTVSGTAIDATSLSAEPFIIRLKLDDPKLADSLNAGAYGEAAVYTPSMQATHVIRRVMMRM